MDFFSEDIAFAYGHLKHIINEFIMGAQWAGIGRQAEVGNPYTISSFLHFFSLATSKIQYLLAKLIMLYPENLKKKKKRVEKQRLAGPH